MLYITITWKLSSWAPISYLKTTGKEKQASVASVSNKSQFTTLLFPLPCLIIAAFSRYPAALMEKAFMFSSTENYWEPNRCSFWYNRLHLLRTNTQCAGFCHLSQKIFPAEVVDNIDYAIPAPIMAGCFLYTTGFCLFFNCCYWEKGKA